MLTTRHQAQLMIMSTFLVGLVVGASGRRLLSGQSFVEQASPSRDMLNEISRAVKLDADQRLQVEPIVNDVHRQYEDFGIQFRLQRDAIRDTCRQRIRVILSQEQRILYDQWILEQDLKRKAREESAKSGR